MSNNKNSKTVMVTIKSYHIHIVVGLHIILFIAGLNFLIQMNSISILS